RPPVPASPVRRVLWLLFFVVDAAVLLATAVGYAALYLNPGPFWWAQLVAVGLPVLAGLVHVLALALLLAKRWALFGLHVAVIALLLLRLVPFEQLRPPPEPGADDLVVMTMNVPRHG